MASFSDHLPVLCHGISAKKDPALDIRIGQGRTRPGDRLGDQVRMKQRRFAKSVAGQFKQHTTEYSILRTEDRFGILGPQHITGIVQSIPGRGARRPRQRAELAVWVQPMFTSECSVWSTEYDVRRTVLFHEIFVPFLPCRQVVGSGDKM